MKFGQAASDYTPASNSDEVWIRGFKDPSTQIRIAPAEMVNDRGRTVYGTDAWPTEREHYADGIGAFPCAERFGIECVGCTDEDEKVRDRTRKYYVNALDDRGQLRVYKLGSGLYKTFKAREARAVALDPSNRQPLSDRDYIINRMGKGLETTYDPEPGDKYSIDFPEKLHDIQQILTDRYEQAVAAYRGDEPAAKKEEEPKDRTPRGSRIEPDEVPNEEPKASRSTVRKAPVQQDQGWGTNPSDEDIESADTGVIKAWLDDQAVEYPSRAPRSRLIAMAKTKAAEPPY